MEKLVLLTIADMGHFNFVLSGTCAEVVGVDILIFCYMLNIILLILFVVG